VSFLVKDKRVELRLSEESYNIIKENDGRFSEIFELGYDIWIEKIPSLLQQKIDTLQQKLKNCTEKTVHCTEITVQRNKDFEELKKIYLEQNRSIDNPKSWDLSWIKSRCQTKKINYERFLMYLIKEGK
jgi:predicted DNA binding CopG/RHH family protein